MAETATTDVATRSASAELVDWVRSDERRNQIALALPEGVSLDRFERATATALLANPDLLKADRASLYLAILQAAQAGLVPDGKQGAIVVFGNKAGFMAMIGGVRDTLAGYGWTLVTSVVYAADEFAIDVAEGRVTHRQPRPGVDRGEIEGAYAMAVHRDGRRMAEMMTVAEINYVRDKSARSKNVWNDWWTRMAEKTVGHRLAKKLPLGEHERDRIQRLITEDFEPGEGAAVLYGQRRPELTEASPGTNPAEGAAESLSDPLGDDGAVVPPDEANEPGPAGTDGISDEPGPATSPDREKADKAGAFNPESAKWPGKTIREIFESGPEGEEWVRWCVQNAKRKAFAQAVREFAAVYVPDALGAQ